MDVIYLNVAECAIVVHFLLSFQVAAQSRTGSVSRLVACIQGFCSGTKLASTVSLMRIEVALLVHSFDLSGRSNSP